MTSIDECDIMVVTEANSPGTIGVVRGATQEVEAPMPDKHTRWIVEVRTANGGTRIRHVRSSLPMGKGSAIRHVSENLKRGESIARVLAGTDK